MLTDGWNSYWKLFDNLCESLFANNKIEIVQQLREAQLFVSGLTDGWYEFLRSFEVIIKQNQTGLSTNEQTLSLQLITELQKLLK